MFILTAGLALAGCGGGGGGGGGDDNGGTGGAAGDTGTLSVYLTDAATVDYRAVYVSIDEIQVHRSGGTWETVGQPQKTYNLLDLVNGVREQLGLAELQSGNYTQMRLILMDTPDDGLNLLFRRHPFANYVILNDNNNTVHELKVPSGFQSGIKIVQGFTVSANGTTELVLDFDAAKSVVRAGNSGKWLLKPTIKMLNTNEASIISGNAGQEGVTVSAQVYDPSAADLQDEVVVQAATVTDANGDYQLFVAPGDYNLTAYKTGFEPDCLTVTTNAGDVLTDQDFSLFQAATDDVTFNLDLGPGGGTDQYGVLSIRETILCDQGVGDVDIELVSVNVADGQSETVTLPQGIYDVVAYSDGKTTQQVQIDTSTQTVVDIDLN